MATASPDITVQTGTCWWCGAVADSREHRLKAGDLRREYGKPPYTNLRTLTRFSGGTRHEFSGPSSKSVKFLPSLCAPCNNTRSQQMDDAWDAFGAYIADHEAEIGAARRIDWTDVFGADWQTCGADVERYVLKHAICRLVEYARDDDEPLRIAAEYVDFLDGGPRPTGLEIRLAIDLDIVEMLRVTREAPPAEQPEAAEAGFLGTTDLWVHLSQSTGYWSEPEAALYYRCIAVHWRLGAGTATPFDRRQITLGTTDAMFGSMLRKALATGPWASARRAWSRLRARGLVRR